MPGISVLFGSHIDDRLRDSVLADLKSEYSPSAEVMFRDGNCTLVFSGGDGYPRWFHEDETAVILFEGIVYNRPVRETGDMLLAIARILSDGGGAEDDVRRFVDGSDGDFLCAVYAKRAQSLLVFNDRLGRLHSFCHERPGMLAVSREIKVLLHCLPEIAIDRLGLAQFLMFEYTLGDTTMFRGVRRFPASGLIRANVTGPLPEDEITVSNTPLLPVNFDETGNPPLKDECIERLSGLFMESLVNRYERCRELGYSCIADVSGGFDTRTVMAGLEKLDADVTYFTHRLVSGDESHVALRLGELYGKPVRVVSASHTPDYDDMERIVYATDCMVNGWTAQTSWRDSFEKRRMVEGKTASFMGFGGEFIRHPFHEAWGHRSLESMLRANLLKAPMNAHWAGFLAGISGETFVDQCAEYFRSYTERTIAGKLKHLYYEYYSILVNAGEDRTRRLFWTVQPLWGKDLYAYEMNEVPLDYAHFAFYTAFMGTIDPKALRAALHRDRVNLESGFGLRLLDLKAGVKYHLRNIVLGNRLTNSLYFRMRGRERNTPAFREAAARALEIYQSLGPAKNWIGRDRIDRFIGQGYGLKNMYRLLSLLMYFRQIEERFPGRIVSE
ncbi:hypothetical protein LLG96_20060 [bacterium]|nr:hypothetical protein [bacterium]